MSPSRALLFTRAVGGQQGSPDSSGALLQRGADSGGRCKCPEL